MEKTLGILGGVGPQATVYFTDMLVRMTDARSDQEHIPTITFNDSLIPDRTAFILDPAAPDPLPRMERDAQLLESAGCDFIVIPCNTAHYFYDEISKCVSVPIINIAEETVRYAREKFPEAKTLGILATEGTLRSQTYKRFTDAYGFECRAPEGDDLASLMSIIYDQVKAGREVDIVEFLRLIGDLRKDGCDAVILGCTELTVINRDFGLKRKDIIDSMEVLARRSIELCGKKVK